MENCQIGGRDSRAMSQAVLELVSGQSEEVLSKGCGLGAWINVWDRCVLIWRS